MIKIEKGREPKELVEYRRKSGASYEGIDRSVKEKVLESLMKEQGHLCAYCMRRIPEKRRLPDGVSPATIEHWFPQNPEDKEDHGQGLDYRNMLAVCAGNRGCKTEKNLTCDARRKNSAIKVNPCNPDTLKGIFYEATGRIRSVDPAIDEDLDKRLNLNCEAISLPEIRKKVLEELLFDIRKKHPNAGSDIRSYCKRRLKKFSEQKEYKEPYVGILIAWLEKHV